MFVLLFTPYDALIDGYLDVFLESNCQDLKT